MGNKTPTQLSFEQKLKDMNVVLPAEAFAIDDTGTYISDETALFCDIYIAGRDDGYNECMQDNDASINNNWRNTMKLSQRLGLGASVGGNAAWLLEIEDGNELRDDVDSSAAGDVDWVGFNGAFGDAQDVAEELIAAQQYARLVRTTTFDRLPVHYEGVRGLSASLTVVHPENADETYVVMTHTGGFVTALMLSKTPFPSRYDVPVTDSLESVVIIDVKEHQVISVAVYTK